MKRLKLRSGNTTKADLYRQYITILPCIGVILATLLYTLANAMYPGSITENKALQGFSWLYSHWYELTSPIANNGDPNPARIVAIFSLLLFYWSVALFLYNASVLFSVLNFFSSFLHCMSIFLALIVVFIYGDRQGIVMDATIITMMTCIAIISIGLYRRALKSAFFLAVICLVGLVFNTRLVYENWFFNGVSYLQKLIFVLVLVWVIIISLRLAFERKPQFEPVG